MNKKGDISLSFGFIFSVIIIVVIIAVAFYAISYFMNLGKCTEIASFYRDFQEEVDRAWSSEIAKETFSASLPGSIDSVCFRHESTIGTGREYDALRDYGRFGANMFLYPPENACEQPSKKLEHADLSALGWYCFPVVDKQVSIKIEKDSSDALARILK